MTTPVLFLLHAASTWALVGLIWVVQLVQYPGFERVGSSEWASFHEHHCSRITWIVAPLMGAELVSALVLAFAEPLSGSTWAWRLGLAAALLPWLFTAFLSVPLHQRLGGRDRSALSALVRTNWPRTLVWSGRGLWTLWVLAGGLPA